MGGKRWTAEDIKLLKRWIGRQPIDRLAEVLRRTPNAIWCKAYQLNLVIANYSYSLTDLIYDTGYNWKQIKKAKDELRQIWKPEQKQGAGSRYYVSKEQKEELLRHLAKPGLKRKDAMYWAPKFHISSCLHCGTKERKHHSHGLCEKCLKRVVRHTIKYNRHKLLIAYWQLAILQGAQPSAVHPLDQLNNWNSCTDLFVHDNFCLLNLRIKE